MSFELIFTLGMLVCLILALSQDKIPVEIVMLVALLGLVCAGVLTMDEALSGFSNPAMLTIAALFVIGAGLQATGAIETLSRAFLGQPKKGTPLLRLIGPVAGLSAFMNNTPLVAFFLPIFVQVAKKLRVAPSKLLIPLSYAAIMGGTCSLIGTSTNFVIDGKMRQSGMPGMGMWEVAWIGVPVTLVGLIYLVTVGQKLLPDRSDALQYAEAHPREYTLELIVRSSCPFVGKTIRSSGLRDLPGLYLYAIDRQGNRLAPVSPDEVIQTTDILCFSGIVNTIIDAQRIRGLEPVEHQDVERDQQGLSLDSLNGLATTSAPRMGQQLCEVVIAPASPLVGQSVKESDFRTRYQASIVAVHRSGEKLQQKIGQIVLIAGDTLLVDAPKNFSRRWANSRDFILVSGVEDSAPVKHRRAWLSLSILTAVVLGMSVYTEHATLVALIGATFTVLSGCLPAREAHRSIEMPILLLIASALGVSKALDTSGAANWIAEILLIGAQPYGKVAVLAAIVILTGLLTELLSNNACAALMSTLALATANQVGMDPRPVLLAVAVTSSYGFATPIGYQTNLMILGPGGYRFGDYLKIGILLDLICWTMTIVIVASLWKL